MHTHKNTVIPNNFIMYLKGLNKQEQPKSETNGKKLQISSKKLIKLRLKEECKGSMKQSLFFESIAENAPLASILQSFS